MPEESPGDAPKLVGECSHPKFLPYGAFAMVVLYWAAKYPPAGSVVPYIGTTTNTVSVSLFGMIGWQSAKEVKIRLVQWWSRHVEIRVIATFWLGKKEEPPP